MSILQYFKKTAIDKDGDAISLPNPRGTLSSYVPTAAISSANSQVRRVISQEQNSERGGYRQKYNNYTPEQRASVGKYALEHGVMSAKRKFSLKFKMDINESTVRRFKTAYLHEKRKRREDDEEEEIQHLPVKKRGRKVVLGQKMDIMVQEYIRRLRETGGVINTAIVRAAAEGILLSQDRTRLQQFGGPATLSSTWAKSLLKRMNFTQRRGTTKAKVSVKEFEKVKTEFLQEIIDVVKMEEIPEQLIFNWDQTGLNLVPVSSWTMEEKGSKRVPIQGMTDKRQITGVFCGTLIGEFLPMQLIYGGKTSRCLPQYSFPRDWHITYTANHWSTEETMIAYINEVVEPYVRSVREDLGMEDQAALAIFDHFKGQLTPKVTECLESYNIQSVLVPPSCTDRLQPLDISVNKAAKTFLRAEFQAWYAGKLQQQFEQEELDPVDLSTPRMKCLGGQ